MEACCFFDLVAQHRVGYLLSSWALGMVHELVADKSLGGKIVNLTVFARTLDLGIFYDVGKEGDGDLVMREWTQQAY